MQQGQFRRKLSIQMQKSQSGTLPGLPTMADRHTLTQVLPIYVLSVQSNLFFPRSVVYWQSWPNKKLPILRQTADRQQTDRQLDRQPDKQTDRQTDRQTNRDKHRQTVRQTYMQTDRQIDRQTAASVREWASGSVGSVVRPARAGGAGGPWPTRFVSAGLLGQTSRGAPELLRHCGCRSAPVAEARRLSAPVWRRS